MWWINFFVCLFLLALIIIIFRSIDLQTIPSEIETKRVKEAGASKQETIKKRKRVLDSDNSPKRKSVISESSQLTDGQSYGAKTDCSQISSDCLSEEEWSENFQDETDEIQGRENKEPSTDLELDKFRSCIDGERLTKEMREAGLLQGLNKYIKDSFDKWVDMKLNIAVTGNSGVGKSSLINALRKLKPMDQGAAAVDIIETTAKGKKYIYPENPNVALWDLPGVGTQKFTKENYFDEMKLYRFDLVIIVSAGRFLENDIWLGKELRIIRKNIIFVRTKIDVDIMNTKRDHPDTFNENECLSKIRKDLSENIRLGGLPDFVSGVFLISSPERELYDFTCFNEKLKNLLSIKGYAIKTILQEFMQRRIQKLQRQVFFSEYMLLFLMPLFLYKDTTKILRKKFDINDTSLDLMAKELNIFAYDLKSNLKSIERPSNSPKSWLKINEEMGKYAFYLASLRLHLLETNLKPIK